VVPLLCQEANLDLGLGLPVRAPPGEVVIGHTGHSGVWGLFLGTTAEKVSRHAACSVLIVR
jgi:hypothetical protein